MRTFQWILMVLSALGLILPASAQVRVTATAPYRTVDQMLLANEINESGEPYAEAIGYNLDDLIPTQPTTPDRIGYVLGIENYEYSRYQLGVLIARSGMGIHLMWGPVIRAQAAMESDPAFDGSFTGGTPNGYKEDDQLKKNIMHFGTLSGHQPPMNPWPQFGEFVEGDPHYMQPPDANTFTHNFATLRWDRSKMSKWLSPDAMGQTLMKQYLWSQDMLGAFHDSDGNEVVATGSNSPDSTNSPHFDAGNNIFYGGDDLDGFVGQVLVAEGINKVKNILTNLAFDGNSLGSVDPMSYDPAAGLRYFPHLISVQETPIPGVALPPQPGNYQVTDPHSLLFDQISLIWGTLNFKNMMDPNNSSDEKHLAYHEAFDGDPFPADMSATGKPGPYDLMKGTSAVIFKNLMAMHFNPAIGSFVDSSTVQGGTLVQGTAITSEVVGYIPVILKLIVEEFAGTPLKNVAKTALNAQAQFILDSLAAPDGGFYNGFTVGSGAWSTPKTAAAQAGLIRGLYAAYQVTGTQSYLDAANSGYNYLIGHFYHRAKHGFLSVEGNPTATYTPRLVALLSGALREARLVGGNTQATQIYVDFWDAVVEKMQLAEGAATGESGNDSDGDGIPFIPEQPNQLAPVFAASAQQQLTGPLSVELTGFSSFVTGKSVVLKWTTASETDNLGFEIQRGSTPRSLEKIGFVKGNQTTSQSHSYRFEDRPTRLGSYYYRLKQIDVNGVTHFSQTLTVTVTAPHHYTLEQNYPNPFNPVTRIRFGLKEPGHVSLIVYDLTGRKVAILINAKLEAGTHSVTFDSRSLPAGIYIYRLVTNGFQAVRKMTLLK